jgi:aldehyde:ferredoxin oxidoreductase
MLDEYYQFRGWNEEGVPGKFKLKALGLEGEGDEYIAYNGSKTV